MSFLIRLLSRSPASAKHDTKASRHERVYTTLIDGLVLTRLSTIPPLRSQEKAQCVHHRPSYRRQGKASKVTLEHRTSEIVIPFTSRKQQASAEHSDLETMEEEPSKYIKLIRYVVLFLV